MQQLDLFAWKDAPREQSATPAPPPIPEPEPEPRPFVKLPPRGDQRAELLKPLRDYQEDAREAVHGHFVAAKRGLGVMATGAGKTVVFAALAADYVAAGGRVLILTDQFDLVDQAVEKLQAMTGLYADVEQGDRLASPRAKVVVATVQSMGNRLDAYSSDWFSLVVCDECDRAIAPMWQKVLAKFQTWARVLGVTATPNRADRKPILRYFETKLFEVGLPELIRRGFLVDVDVREVPLCIDLTAAEEGAEDYDPEKLGHAVEGIFAEVCEALREYAPERKTLVFLPDVATSKKFAATASLHGWNARHVDGESRDRKALKRGFSEWRRNGQHDHNAFQVLCNPMLLSRGYDEPSVDCIVNLRPTKSVGLYHQIVGRGTRLWCPWGCGGPCEHQERKRDLLVLDFLYQFKGMAPVSPASLVTDSPEKQAEIKRLLAQGRQLNLLDAADQAGANMEAALLRALTEAQKAHQGFKGEYFNALQWAANLHAPDLLDYIPETEADQAPVPERIQKRLSKAGFIPDSVVCVGHALKLLKVVETRREAGLASAKQVFWLRKWGYKDPWNMTAKAAKSILFRTFNDAGKLKG